MKIEDLEKDSLIKIIWLTDRDAAGKFAHTIAKVEEKLDVGQVMIRTRGMLEKEGVVVTLQTPRLLGQSLIITNDDIFEKCELNN